ncbi:hypothetical protein BCR34DRAFT_566300 [Clohesyomyces aquaticus]|uniref:Zn(2)-C6 fungal-type domain-containing protein n=1 Tax=Clohesyomyces aquaticus TaxID=1231657 RepID=A0A1Y1ZL25_9PLEO|nr:hypothetical protein BCR34DRAFT_566300 [Clohesyomyces aquaticus]
MRRQFHHQTSSLLVMYGIPKPKACQGCAEAKAKCEPEVGSDRCKRCTIYGIECSVRVPAPRKRRRAAQSDGANEIQGPNLVLPCTLQEVTQGREHYRKSMEHSFPFVILPEKLPSVEQFIREQAFLALVMAMLGCIQDRSRQRDLAVKAREYLGVAMLQCGQKTLDMLQGLLLLMNWYHYQFELPSQRSVFMHLAMSLVVDLELNKSPFTRNRLKRIGEATHGFDVDTSKAPDHTLDQRRAFLGCLYMSSVMGKSVLNMDALRFSEYSHRCCAVIEASGLPSDQVLVHMMRLQYVVEKFEDARSRFIQRRLAASLVLEPQNRSYNGESIRVEETFDFDRWDRQLTQGWDRIPPNDKTELLCVQYHYARVCLYQDCLEDALFSTDADRLVVIHKCVAAIKSLNDIFHPMDQRPHMLLNVPTLVFTQSSHAIFLTVQLFSLRCEGWSGRMVEEKLEFQEILESAGRNLGQLMERMPPIQIPQFFKGLVPVAKDLRKWYAAKIRAVASSEPIVENSLSEEKEADFDLVDLGLFGQFLDLDDNFWLQNMLGASGGQMGPDEPGGFGASW